MILSELFNTENTLNLDYRILSCLAVLLTLSIFFIVLGIKRFFRGKILSAGIQSLSGVSLLLGGLLFLSIATNLYSYDRLTYEQDIAELTFAQLGEQQFRVEITYTNQDKIENFLVNGDEWQMDARVIKWHGWAQLAGLNAQYRLERISGRYSDINDERQKPRSVYSLAQEESIDYWKLIQNYKKWLPWIDAHYGSATYLPMADKATYTVSLTQTGLIARTAQE
jgi:TM2 domain-containing membrane protein YozV